MHASTRSNGAWSYRVGVTTVAFSIRPGRRHFGPYVGSDARKTYKHISEPCAERGHQLVEVWPFGCRIGNYTKTGIWHSRRAILGTPFDETPPIGAIAIPIITADGIHGSLSLLWLEEHLSADTVIRSGLLERLKA